MMAIIYPGKSFRKKKEDKAIGRKKEEEDQGLIETGDDKKNGTLIARDGKSPVESNLMSPSLVCRDKGKFLPRKETSINMCIRALSTLVFSDMFRLGIANHQEKRFNKKFTVYFLASF